MVLRLLSIFFLSLYNLQGQIPQQITNSAPDSVTIQQFDSLGVKTDTLSSKPFQLNPVNSHFMSLPDTTFVQTQIISTIYNGFADIFRRKSDFQVYDFLEMGQPRFVAPLHLLPHQSAVFNEGHLLNDPLNGMYNLRFLSLDAVETVQATTAGFSTTTNSQQLQNTINVGGKILNPEKPNTRLMFRQGDFGYTDLDIRFAQRLNEHLSIQLGGLNKLNNINQHHGVIYKGALNFQASPKLFSRTQVRINDDRMKIYGIGDYSLFTYSEERQEFLQSFTYLIDPEKDVRLHLRAGFSGNRRKNSSAIDSFKVKYRFQRSYFELERNLRTGPLNWIGGLSYNQTQVWGNALESDHNQTDFGSILLLDYSLLNSLNIMPSLKWNKQWNGSAFLSSSFLVKYHLSKVMQMHFDLRQDRRRPNANESYFEYDQFRGNDQLQDEEISSVIASADFNFIKSLNLKLNSGYREIKKEITFDSTTFKNGSSRSFVYLGGNASLDLNIFRFGLGGQVSSGKNLIGPEYSGWMQLNYHDAWLNGAVIIDAIGQVHYFGPQNRIQYHPIIERFYPTNAQFDPFYTLSYKIVATVKSAELYLAMDNPLSTKYTFIDGYPEIYRRVRFGLNWVLWE